MAWQARRDTEADARSENPTLASGEIGVITDRNKVVVGDGSTAYQSLAAIFPTGMIMPFGGSTAPDGFLSCDGTAVSRTTYADLFAAIGTAWGVGDGSTTFNLPDLRGHALRGTGTHGSEADAAGANYAGPSVGSFQDDRMQGHRHLDPFSATTSLSPISSECSYIGGYPNTREGIGDSGRNTAVTTSRPYTDDTNGTPRTGSETRMANAGVLFVIKT